MCFSYSSFSLPDQSPHTLQDLEGISEKLGEMRDALAGLVNLPDYSDRCDRLNNLSNRLEAILSPKLISTFNK